jgi:site-specific DNA recombinase
MKAIGYARVSTDKQAESGCSLDDQQDRIKARCVADKLELVDVIVDDGYTSSTLDRPGMARLLQMVRRKQVQCVVITKLDRLTRSVRDFQVLLDLFERYGVSIVSMGESVDTSCAVGKMVLNVIMSVLQWHREEISEKTAAVLHHKRSKGEKTGGRVPFGYDVQVVSTKLDGTPVKGLMENETEQKVLAWMRDKKAAGWSLQKIADDLNKRGVTTKEGSAWRRQYLHRILKSEA